MSPLTRRICCRFAPLLLLTAAALPLSAQELLTTGDPAKVTTAPEPVDASKLPVDVIRVEEDWELVLRTPEVANQLPQVVNVMGPHTTLMTPYIVFELNHSTMPTFQAGGMQLQGWFSDIGFDLRYGPKLGTLSTPNEVVTYTIAMEAKENHLTYEVINGKSQTWEKFGGEGYLKLRYPTLFTKLNTYTPKVSVENSGVGRGAHNVDHFCLKQIRYYSADGLIATDQVERCIHEYKVDVTYSEYELLKQTKYIDPDAVLTTDSYELLVK